MGTTNTHLSIKLTGTDVNLSLNPIGVTVSYTINEVPVAIVDLDARDMVHLCDFEAFRRKRVLIRIDSEFGCLKFEGIIDGLSMYQSVGNVRLQLVVKNEFQYLKEVYPRMPGFHPTSMDIFKRVEPIEISSEFGKFFKSLDIGALTKPDTSRNVIDFLIQASKTFIEAQKQVKIVSNVAKDTAPIVQLASEFAEKTLPRALERINKIDTSFVKGLIYNASDHVVSSQVLSNLAESSDTFFNTLISWLADFGCVLVISNSKAFIVPDAGFLKISHAHSGSKINIGQKAPLANIIYPAEYDSISFNDNGYRDIKAVYVVADPNVQLLNKTFTAELGFYVDEDPRTQGGVLTLPLPYAVAVGVAGAYNEATQKAVKAFEERLANQKEEITEEDAKKSVQATERKLEDSALKLQEGYIHNWAELKYLQAKYMDRIGNISMKFNPRWAPGAVGSAFIRHPGTFVDFFVTSVTHRFQVDAPNTAVAVTEVNFNCGRIGSLVSGSGIDKVAMYDYDGALSLAFAEAFVVNNSLLDSQTQGFE